MGNGYFPAATRPAVQISLGCDGHRGWADRNCGCAVALLLWALGLASSAETKPRDPLADALFPPELVLQRQSEISLSDQQREAIMSEVQKAQERFTEMQGRLQKEVEALSAILQK